MGLYLPGTSYPPGSVYATCPHKVPLPLHRQPCANLPRAALFIFHCRLTDLAACQAANCDRAVPVLRAGFDDHLWGGVSVLVCECVCAHLSMCVCRTMELFSDSNMPEPVLHPVYWLSLSPRDFGFISGYAALSGCGQSSSPLCASGSPSALRV